MTPGQEALAEAARLESARVYGTTTREHRQPPQRAAQGAQGVFERPAETFYGPAPKVLLAELLEAVVPVKPPRSTPGRRVEIETAIARGWTETVIGDRLSATVEEIRLVRADMDRAAS